MKKVSLLISAILVCNSLAYSQESLLLSLNSYRAGDKIIKQQMTFPVQITLGVSGQSISQHTQNWVESW